MKIGVLALQGDFKEHIEALKKLDAWGFEVRTSKDLDKAEGLIIPGGESTTISKLMLRNGLFEKIKESKIPIYGTCAGSILLAKKIVENNLPNLNLIDISVKRNDYGRQIDSFEAKIDVKDIGEINGIFIRAPVIYKVGRKVEILAEHNGNVVVAKQGNVLVSTFHPELTSDRSLHEYFLGMIIKDNF